MRLSSRASLALWQPFCSGQGPGDRGRRAAGRSAPATAFWPEKFEGEAPSCHCGEKSPSRSRGEVQHCVCRCFLRCLGCSGRSSERWGATPFRCPPEARSDHGTGARVGGGPPDGRPRERGDLGVSRVASSLSETEMWRSGRRWRREGGRALPGPRRDFPAAAARLVAQRRAGLVKCPGRTLGGGGG